MKKNLLFAFGFAISLFMTSSAFAGITWLTANNESCATVCSDEGKSPVISDVFRANGQPYYVCSAYAKNQGYRPGFNVPGTGVANKCGTAYGSERIDAVSFRCLCQD